MVDKSKKTSLALENAEISASTFQERKLRRRLAKGKLSTIVVSKTVPLTAAEQLRKKKRLSRTSVRNRNYAATLAQKDKIIIPAVSTSFLLWKDVKYKPRTFEKPSKEGFKFRDPDEKKEKPAEVTPVKSLFQRRLHSDKTGIVNFKTVRDSTGKLIRIILSKTPKESPVTSKELPEVVSNTTTVAETADKAVREKYGFPEKKKKKRKSSKPLTTPTINPNSNESEAEVPKARGRGRPRKVDPDKVQLGETYIPNFDKTAVEPAKKSPLPVRKPLFDEVLGMFMDQHQDRLDEIFDKHIESASEVVEKGVAAVERERIRELRKLEVRDCSHQEFHDNVLEPLPKNEVTKGIGIKGTKNEWSYLQKDRDTAQGLSNKQNNAYSEGLSSDPGEAQLSPEERLFRLEIVLTKPKFKVSAEWVDGVGYKQPVLDDTSVMVPADELASYRKWRATFVREATPEQPQFAESVSQEVPLYKVRSCACRQLMQTIIVGVEEFGIGVQRCCLILKHLVLSNPSRFKYLFVKDRITVRTNILSLLSEHVNLLCDRLLGLTTGSQICNIKVSYGTRIEVFLTHNKFIKAQMEALCRLFASCEKEVEIAPGVIREVHAFCNELYQAVSCIHKDVILFYLYLDYPTWSYYCNRFYQRSLYLDTRNKRASLNVLNFVRAKQHDFLFHPSDGANLLHLDSNYYRNSS